jgi:hypothetical protein
LEKSVRYVLLTGQGRSGTNWLVDILDLSPRTHCRNEPALEGSALSRLPNGWPQNRDLEALWDQAVADTARSMGMRDHLLQVRKAYFRPGVQALGLVRIVQSYRCRRVLGHLVPAWHTNEWPIPRWLASERDLARALHVFKINQKPGWITWVLKNRPEARVLHIVRHPGGFFNSYAKRWLALADAEQVLRDNRARLEMVAASDPAWAERFGDIASLSLVEAELWFWRYAAESIHAAGQNSSQYQLIVYEDLVRDPLGVARAAYDGCGLPWTATIEQTIQRMAQESEAIATAWRKKLKGEHREMVERILEDSPLREWWPEPSVDVVS